MLMALRQDRKWILIFSLFVMIITMIPYLLGFWFQGDSWAFTGFVFGVEDGNSYIAKMLSGANGHWLFSTPYTASEQKGAFAFFPYLLLGKLTSPPGQHAQLVAMFQIYRFFGGMLMCFASYDFISIFTEKKSYRRLGTSLATIGGGLGWLSVFGLQVLWNDRLPLEFYSPETFGFLSLFGLPHLAVARSLLLWGLRWYLAPLKEKSIRTNGIMGGVLWLFLGLMQPLTVVVGWAVLGAHLVVLAFVQFYQHKKTHRVSWVIWKDYFGKAVWMGGISSPIVLYTFFSFTFDPYLKGWTEQNLILSPPIVDYLLAYGLILPLTVLGIKQSLQKQNAAGLLLTGWLFIFPLLAYAPYNLQRRLPEGVWMAVISLGIIGIETINQERLRKLLAKFIFLSFLTTSFVLIGSLFALRQPQMPLYRPQPEVDVFKYLALHVDDRDVVLASYPVSNALPAWAPVRTLIGHGPESVNLKSVQPRVEQFFDSNTSFQVREGLLEEFDVDYVLWSPEELKLGDYNLLADQSLKMVYDVGEYRVFEVIKEGKKLKK